MEEQHEAPAAGARRALIVEDDEGLRNLILKSLTKAGIEVQGAVKGADAIARVEQDLDLVLVLDQKLPDMTGRDIIVALAEKGIRVPFVMITGQGDERLAVEIMKLGAADYITKGLDLIDLLPGVLRRLFNRLDMERQLRAAEASLRASERRYRELVDNANSIIVRLTPDGTITYFNEFASRFLGFSHEEITGRNAVGTIVPEMDSNGSDTGALLRDIFAHPERYKDNENENIRKDGARIWVSWNNTPIFDDDGKYIELLCIGADITERKRAEEALREREETFRALAENSQDVIMRFDAGGRHLYVNPAVKEQTGIEPGEFIGKTHQELGFPQPLCDRWRNVIAEVFASGDVRRMEFQLPSGIWLDWLLMPEFDDARAVKAVITAARDITERKKTEEERERLREQLNQAQKMESVGRLAGGVAHDFNNMLSVILGHTELTLEDMNPAEPLYDVLQEVRQAAKRSAELTRQLLAFARKQAAVPKILDLNDTVEGMLKMLRRLIGEDIDLAWRPGNSAGSIKMDPSQIDQILANLCVNARDAIGGVGKVTIETGAAVIDEHYCVSHPGALPGAYSMLAVGDNGCGMDKFTLDSLFEPFFTTKETGKGTGLGLATVYGIVKQNDGLINVYSEPGKGTVFKLYFPIHNEAPRETLRQNPLKSSPRGDETILLVEDEPGILKMAAHMLKRQGYSVMAAATPHEAIALARQFDGHIHLLMTDVIMPEMNGRDLALTLKAARPDLKCLFMSGYTANVIAHHGVLEPGVNFIQKPFALSDLATKVRRTLDMNA